MFKRLFLTVVLALSITGLAFAGESNHGNNSDVDNSSKNVNENKQENKNTATQAQSQDQVAKQGNTQSSSTSQDSRYFSPAYTPAQTGTDNINASSPLFNAGISSTKKFVILNEQYKLIQQMKADNYLSAEEAKMESRLVLEGFKAETRRKKVLGFLPATQKICDNSMVATVPLVCE